MDWFELGLPGPNWHSLINHALWILELIFTKIFLLWKGRWSVVIHNKIKCGSTSQDCSTSKTSNFSLKIIYEMRVPSLFSREISCPYLPALQARFTIAVIFFFSCILLGMRFMCKPFLCPSMLVILSCFGVVHGKVQFGTNRFVWKDLF